MAASTNRRLSNVEFIAVRKKGQGYLGNIMGGEAGNILHKASCDDLWRMKADSGEKLHWSEVIDAVRGMQERCGDDWHPCRHCMGLGREHWVARFLGTRAASPASPARPMLSVSRQERMYPLQSG